MSSRAVGAGVVADVGRGRAHRQPVLRERVFDAEHEQERIARPRVEHVLEHGAVGLPLDDGPGRPADEPVDRGARGKLVERQLVAAAVELEAPVLEPVRPRRHDLPPAGEAHLLGSVAVEQLEAVDRVRAKPAADLDHDDALVAEDELGLLTGGSDSGGHVESRRWLARDRGCLRPRAARAGGRRPGASSPSR